MDGLLFASRTHSTAVSVAIFDPGATNCRVPRSVRTAVEGPRRSAENRQPAKETDGHYAIAVSRSMLPLGGRASHDDGLGGVERYRQSSTCSPPIRWNSPTFEVTTTKPLANAVPAISTS